MAILLKHKFLSNTQENDQNVIQWRAKNTK